MRPQEIIAKKRDGRELSNGEIDAFIDGVCDGSWADYQISALVMAMFTRGLNAEEQGALTHAMLHSGEVLDLSDIARPKADKHSTGGVGDKTSLIIAPIVAACGVAVPMISGRGLGHTGGTLDKLESIPGYNVNLTTAEFRSVVDRCGFAMMSQTEDIAPADKKLYALRDATATVPYIPLIVASIMSKKLAEGLDALILDVKTGSGAFMQNADDSRNLAEALVRTGKNFGVKTEAVVTDMSQPLGRFVGNLLEVYECIRILRGEIDHRWEQTRQLSLELSARILVLARIADDIEAARKLAESKIASGDALAKFQQNCELQGGDPRICDDMGNLLDKNLLAVEIKSETSGFVAAIDASAIGESIVQIGGGRTKAEDGIDHKVGYACEVKIGEPVDIDQTLGVLYCRDRMQIDLIRKKLRNAYTVGDKKPKTISLVQTVIS